ncbi:MAG: transcriptional regulator [Rhodocyclaceae bacterium]|nr:transcriptional regulator [Rhodocyclaceae bacterium]MBX3670479.1 transcriptional regulator [Rhodocyclaceae bacterium]
MYTVIETPTFARLAAHCWNDDEKTEFITFISANPHAGDVVPGSGGLRKVRWTRSGRGKRGGVRIIYYDRLANGEIWLLIVYGKSVKENIPAHVLRQIREELEHAQK